MHRLIATILSVLIYIPSMSAQKPAFRELPPAGVASLDRQRAFVAELATQHALKKVTGTTADYDLIQEIVSKKLIGKAEKWKLQALGVVFGDVLISEEPKLRWMQVTDAYGTDPTIVFGDSSYQLNALTMISKRVEGGDESLFVHSLARIALKMAREEGPKADKR